MAVFLSDTVLDAALDVIATADQLIICAGEPADYTDATTDSGSGGHALGEVAVSSGDFTKADGDASGRKVTVAQKTGVTIDVSGTADHVALVDDGASVLLAVATITSQAVTATNTATINAFDIEIGDPS